MKTTFVRRASEFLRNYFASLVDFMISDKSYFSQVFLSFMFFCLEESSVLGLRLLSYLSLCKQRGQLKRPDHADLRYKCRTYARLLQHLKVKLWTLCVCVCVEGGFACACFWLYDLICKTCFLYDFLCFQFSES